MTFDEVPVGACLLLRRRLPASPICGSEVSNVMRYTETMPGTKTASNKVEFLGGGWISVDKPTAVEVVEVR